MTGARSRQMHGMNAQHPMWSQLRGSPWPQLCQPPRSVRIGNQLFIALVLIIIAAAFVILGARSVPKDANRRDFVRPPWSTRDCL